MLLRIAFWWKERVVLNLHGQLWGVRRKLFGLETNNHYRKRMLERIKSPMPLDKPWYLKS